MSLVVVVLCGACSFFAVKADALTTVTRTIFKDVVQFSRACGHFQQNTLAHGTIEMRQLDCCQRLDATSFISVHLETRDVTNSSCQHRDATNYASVHLETFMSCEFNLIEVSRRQAHYS